MLNQPKPTNTSNPSFIRRSLIGAIGLAFCALSGCQDGPMYAIKSINPYYTMHEWKLDEEIGITDHQRREQLSSLADTIGDMSLEDQKGWSEHLNKLFENDESPEMRRLVMKAAGNSKDPTALDLIKRGLEDESMKVRMEACSALGNRTDDESARMLATVVGTETNQNVKHAAVRAMKGHKSQIAISALKNALADRDPATRHLAVQSLKGSTSKDYGDDPKVWIAALEGNPPSEEAPTRIADRIRNLF